jgi:hypothetical protein
MYQHAVCESSAPTLTHPCSLGACAASLRGQCLARKAHRREARGANRRVGACILLHIIRGAVRERLAVIDPPEAASRAIDRQQQGAARAGRRERERELWVRARAHVNVWRPTSAQSMNTCMTWLMVPVLNVRWAGHWLLCPRERERESDSQSILTRSLLLLGGCLAPEAPPP